MLRLIFLLFIIFSFHAYPQEIKITRDLAMWTELELEKSLFNKFDVNIRQELRMCHTISRIDDYIADIGIRYSIDKHFRIGVNGRYTCNLKRVGNFENNFRYNLDFCYLTNKIRSFRLYYRLRYQKEYIDPFTYKPNQHEYHSAVRNQIEVKYFFNNSCLLFSSAELFRQIDVFKEPEFNKWRFFIGHQYNFHYGNVHLALGMEREINTRYPCSMYIVKLGYCCKL